MIISTEGRYKIILSIQQHIQSLIKVEFGKIKIQSLKKAYWVNTVGCTVQHSNLYTICANKTNNYDLLHIDSNPSFPNRCYSLWVKPLSSATGVINLLLHHSVATLVSSWYLFLQFHHFQIPNFQQISPASTTQPQTLHVACEVLQTWLYVTTPHLLFSSWCCVSLRQMGFSPILLIARPMKFQVSKVLCKKTKKY